MAFDQTAYVREWRRKKKELNPDLRRDEALRTRYGMTSQDVDRLLVEQKFACKICEKPFTRFRGRGGPYVDHNHETGAVRGILCASCNTGLKFLEDKVYFQLAIAYLSEEGK